MLNDERNNLHYDNNDKKVSWFTLDGSCHAASLFLWTPSDAMAHPVANLGTGTGTPGSTVGGQNF
jgi:hypothetical protein